VETFVVQILTLVDETDPNRDDLRGFVEHVHSGRREPFRNAHELLAFFKPQRDPQPQEVER
jgi:hypothetical protein